MKIPTLAATVALALATGPAHALVEIWDGCCGTHLVADLSATASISQNLDELSGLSGHYFAGAATDLAAGTVGGSITAFRSDSGGITGPLEVHTYSQVGDVLTFSGPAPVVVEFTYRVSGSFGLLDLGGLYANSTFYAGTTRYFNILWGGGIAEPTALYNSNAELSNVSMDPLGLTGTMHIRTLVTPDVPISVGAILELKAVPARQEWAHVNFGHTGRIAVNLPEGYSFTSASGLFLTAPPVPEPPVWALWLAAAAACAAARRTRAAAR